MIRELSPTELHRTCDPTGLDCESRPKDGPQETIIGQARAVRAMRFGLDIQSKGFNIFAAGLPGTGRTTAVERFLGEIATARPVPPDWCYVHSFEDSYRPRAIRLPAGKAREFQKDIENLLKAIQQEIKASFESEQYDAHQENALKSFEQQKDQILEKLGAQAQEKGFTLQATPTGVEAIAIKDGETLSDKDFLALDEEGREHLKQAQDEIEDAIEVAFRQVRVLDNGAQEALTQLDRQMVQFVLDHLMAPLLEKYQPLPEILAHLQAIQGNILENIERFKPKEEEDEPASPGPERSPMHRYRVNVLVDNSKLSGAPVILEMNPTYSNLFGRIEQEAYMGTLVTDFTLIRGGSLHRANGGYLVMPSEDVIRNPFAWESLKRCLRNQEIAIEEPVEQPVFTTKSLRPEAIPLQVKVILIGHADTYQTLLAYDEHFSELFKVKADFDSQMERSEQHIQDYASFVCMLCEAEKLPHLDATGLARVVEHGSRLAEDQDKLSTRFGEIADIIREASYYANKEGAARVSASHIERTIEERFYRSGLVQERIQEMIARDVIRIDTRGEAVGQVNGMSVMDVGDLAFGQPSRITASVGMGEEGLVNVEREAEMSGPLHNKGVLILSGYLTQQFAQDKPLSLNAHLVFEQNYGGVEGDSASSAELYAILSALSGLPVRQGIGVTGSVNQRGEVQAIGGVNEKIEGFYAVCKAKGLDGAQGVLIPVANLSNLMLKEEVVDAVRQGRFHIWCVQTIDEGIEALTGVPGGARQADGRFPEGTVNYLVDERLRRLAETMAEFGEDGPPHPQPSRKAQGKPRSRDREAEEG